MRARILSQGDELLTGATTDTNAGWLARLLYAHGVEVVGFAAAPDDPDAIAALLRGAGADADLVVSTGGLGPTDDDYSAEAAARASGRALREDPEARRQVEARFRALRRDMPACNLRQARLPEGATLLENLAGTAPGFAVEIGRARAFFFPGVPRELFIMAEQHLVPWLTAHGAAPAGRKRFHVCGVGESTLQERLAGYVPPDGVRLGYKTWLPYNSVLLYSRPGAEAGLRAAADIVRERLGADVFGEDDETQAGVVGARLAARGWTLAVAESCTGGGLGALLTEAPGSSAWFRGGVIAYANGVKEQLLGVPAAVLAADGAVSEACAAAMAEGARRATGADVGLSITGVAGPDGGTPAKPVGTVCMGLALPDGATARTARYGARGRDLVRTLAAAQALEWLRRKLVVSQP